MARLSIASELVHRNEQPLINLKLTPPLLILMQNVDRVGRGMEGEDEDSAGCQAWSKLYGVSADFSR